MSIVVYPVNPNDCQSLIPWGARFARASRLPLVVALPLKSKGKVALRDIDATTDPGERAILGAALAAVHELDDRFTTDSDYAEQPDSDERPAHTLVRLFELMAPDPNGSLAEQSGKLDAELLLVAAHETAKSKAQTDHWIYGLIAETACETMLIRGGCPESEPLNVLIATQGESDTDVALIRGKQLCDEFGGELSLLFVRPNDDRYALQVAKLQLQRLSKNVQVKLDDVSTSILLREKFTAAIEEHCQEHPVDLVLVGTRQQRRIRALMRPRAEDGKQSCAIAAVREGIPLSSRLHREFRVRVRSIVPQLERESRIKLVDRLQTNSRFDFDFIALIVLSTVIAAFGLVQNSGAVVIGAMLVAPLMTPLVGTGFGLVQGNWFLVRRAIVSTLSGFAIAFLVGLAVGLVVQGSMLLGLLTQGVEVNSELQARGHPNLLDFIIALASGIAAAYAMGRPNLLSALPGVAIAAALVPPIATSGLALAIAQWGLSIWALLLFFTNIVAIVLGTTIAFWCVGIDSGYQEKHDSGRPKVVWPRILLMALVIVSIILATIMSLRKRELSPRGLSPPATAVEPLADTGQSN